jgi:hypothetical protein
MNFPSHAHREKLSGVLVGEKGASPAGLVAYWLSAVDLGILPFHGLWFSRPRERQSFGGTFVSTAEN